MLGHRSDIKPPLNHLSEQCHGPTKTRRSSNARQSLRVPLPFPRLLPSPLAGQRLRQPTPSNRESGKAGLLACCNKHCGQSRIAPYCERQDALLRTRRIFVKKPVQNPRTALFFIMPPLRNHLAFPLPSAILGPTAHPRPSYFGPSTSPHGCTTYLLPYPLPISAANSSLDAQPKRHTSQMPPFSQHGQGLAEANQK
jgi:hypothetical protein